MYILMGSIPKTVYYCCVSKGSRILYEYSGGDPEIEKMASMCLERSPAYHTWYFHTMGKKIFGFLMEDEYVYFAIVDENLGKIGVLKFLEHVRDEFKKVAKKGSSRSFSNSNSLRLQEQLVPVIRQLITSLEQVSEMSDDWPRETHSPNCDNANGNIEGGSITKAPLLGKPNKHEKKKMKDHVVDMREIELEEHRRSIDRGVKVESKTIDSNGQNASSSGSNIALQKDLGSTWTRSSTQNVRKKWCRHVRIILMIDVVVCLLLFGIWLVICRGIKCIR